MGKRGLGWTVAVIVLVVLGIWTWEPWALSPESQIKRRLQECAAEFNSSTSDGLAGAARVGRLGQYFTPEVVIELGGGSPPIHGRDTLMGMAARLQPRTAAFVLELNDINVHIVDDTRANLALTAVIRRRNINSGEQSFDAREFSVEMQHTAGDWRINRVSAVETLKK